MVSVLSASSLPSVMSEKSSILPVQVHEMDNIRDAADPFTKMIARNGNSVRLHCTIPTWCPTSDTCIDLHDLHDLRTRFFVFIHILLESLRASGVSATYALAPSDSSLCLVCALPSSTSASNAKMVAIEAFQNAKLTQKDKVLIADTEQGPALIMT